MLLVNSMVHSAHDDGGHQDRDCDRYVRPPGVSVVAVCNGSGGIKYIFLCFVSSVCWITCGGGVTGFFVDSITLGDSVVLL